MTTVLYLNPSASLGGAERSLLGLLTRSPKTQFRPLVVVPHPGPLVEELERVGIRTVCIPPGRWVLSLSRRTLGLNLVMGPLALPKLWRASGQLIRLVREERVRLIYTNGIKAHLWGGLVGWWVGLPVICHLRDILENRWAERWISWWIRRMATVIIAPSQAVAQSVMRKDPDHSSKVAVVPNGIDLEQVQPRPSPSPGAGYRVGIVGSLTPRKGQDIFLQAAKLVIQQIPAVHFFIVGDEIYETWAKRSFREQLDRLTDSLGLTPHVTFTGFVRDPIGWMQGFDVIVSASVKPEGFGRVLLEAMALAKPVIATAVGAYPEVVEDGVTGFLVPSADPEALAQAICQLLKDSDLRDRMSRAGRLRAEKRFSLGDHVRSVEQICQEVLRGKP